jgi:hypothetical protein
MADMYVIGEPLPATIDPLWPSVRYISLTEAMRCPFSLGICQSG